MGADVKCLLLSILEDNNDCELVNVRTFLSFLYFTRTIQDSNPRPCLIHRLSLDPYLYTLTILI